MRLDEIRELSRARFLLFFREPEALFWVFGFPLVLSAVLGFAFRRGDVPKSELAVLAGPGADELERALAAADGVRVRRVQDLAEARRALFRGEIDLALEPRGAEPPTLHLDPDRPEAETARLRAVAALDPSPPPALPVDARTAPGSRYVDFLFPGLLGMNLMGTGMWVVGMAVAEMRQKKVLRRLLVTPMRRSSLLLSLLLSRGAFLGIEVVVLTAFGTLALGVPFRGSLLGFGALCVLGGTAFAGLGLLAVSRVRTLQAASGLLNFFMLPMWLLSGVFFSYERFPEALHPVIRLLPLTALNDALRASLLEGEGLGGLGFELAVQGAWGLAAFLLALRVFRWE